MYPRVALLSPLLLLPHAAHALEWGASNWGETVWGFSALDDAVAIPVMGLGALLVLATLVAFTPLAAKARRLLQRDK